jgi:hypothetical protein
MSFYMPNLLDNKQFSVYSFEFSVRKNLVNKRFLKREPQNHFLNLLIGKAIKETRSEK